MPMSAEIKAQWTTALRSGEFEQGMHWLRCGDTYCCLGVLCDLAVKAGVIEQEKGHASDAYYYGPEGGNADVLPHEVKEWAGLDDSNPPVDLAAVPAELAAQVSAHECNPEAISLAGLNDSGTPFAVIADIIDAQL